MTSKYNVIGMTCASCASSLESMLLSVDGVETATVNLANNTVQVKHGPDVGFKDLKTAVQQINYDLIADREEADITAQELYQRAKLNTLWAAILTIPVFILGMFFHHWQPGHFISLALTTPVLCWFGRSFFTNAYQQLKKGKANMDTLVAMSTSVAYLFSLFNTIFPDYWVKQGLNVTVYYEAASVIITFISLGKVLEYRARSKTDTAITQLIGLQPDKALVLVNGSPQEKLVADIVVGDEILVNAGARIPVDGVVLKGKSTIDQSMINGEPIPVEKSVGDLVFAGTINQHGSITFKANAIGSSTLLGRIIEMVTKAQGSKAPVQKLVDRISAIFVPVVIALAALTFVVWSLAPVEQGIQTALFNAVAVLVIACPCALGLATPTAIMVGVGKGGKSSQSDPLNPVLTDPLYHTCKKVLSISC